MHFARPRLQVELPLWVEEGPTFQGLQLLPDQALPVDIASEVSDTEEQHTGGRGSGVATLQQPLGLLDDR